MMVHVPLPGGKVSKSLNEVVVVMDKQLILCASLSV